MSKITKIEEVVSQEWVYDPVCSEPNTYIANGIVNHNCVLWIDEVEKAMSGVKSSNFSDAGTMSRVFGTFLTWMQEKQAEVVVLATANDITQVPPEFIRRFNEVFFVDMPVDAERKEIFEIHLLKRDRKPEKFDLEALVKATKNYTGAEIEKAVKHGLAQAWNDQAKDVTTKHILDAVEGTKPIFTVMGEKIQTIRSWARDRARYASTAAKDANAPGAQSVTVGGKEVDLDTALDLGDIITDDVKIKKGDQKEEPEDLVMN